MEKSDETVKAILGKEYVHFSDAIPEIGQFLVELDRKEKE